MSRSSNSPFEINDDNWNEYVEEMESIRLDFDEEFDEDRTEIFEEDGIVKVQNSKGEGIAIPLGHFIEVMRKVGDCCPFCHGWLGYTVTPNSRKNIISVLRLWCVRCGKTFEVIENEIYAVDD